MKGITKKEHENNMKKESKKWEKKGKNRGNKKRKMYREW